MEERTYRCSSYSSREISSKPQVPIVHSATARRCVVSVTSINIAAKAADIERINVYRLASCHCCHTFLHRPIPRQPVDVGVLLVLQISSSYMHALSLASYTVLLVTVSSVMAGWNWARNSASVMVGRSSSPAKEKYFGLWSIQISLVKVNASLAFFSKTPGEMP